jgi:Mg2+-importing ATPase
MHGLDDADASARLIKAGPNYVEFKKPSWTKVLFRQLHSFFTYLLLIASGINIALGSYTDAAIIAAFVAIYVIAGLLQEFKAEQTIFSLRTFLPQYTKVRRNGTVTSIDSKGLVPGDIIFLHEGDLVPADVRLLHTKHLLLDESALTGESAPVAKDGAPPASLPEDDLGCPTLAFFGSTVVGGFAQALVIGTGATTYFSHLFETVNAIDHPSLFEVNVRKIGKFLSNLIVFLALAAFLARIITAQEADISFLVFLIALVIAAVPEALPLVVTLTLSKGALSLAKQHVVVKRLTSLEDLGNIDVVCSDKTGTITENKLSVAATFGSDTEGLIQAAFASSLSGKKIGKLINPFDTALFARMTPEAVRQIGKLEFEEFLPFDAIRRVNSVAYRERGDWHLITRGAPEAILAASTHMRSEHGASIPFPENERENALAWFKERGFLGDRVLAVGIKQIPKGASLAHEEREGLEFLGLIAFHDPLKASSREALTLIRELKIDLLIITGDAAEVAGAVGYELGLLTSKDEVMTGMAFEALSPDARREAVRTCRVFARTSPLHKQLIIETLRACGKSVAFLGDGFNDVPALKAAEVALTVHTAADMAKSVSDIVLLQDDLLVIAKGILEGRKMFANVVKYIRTTLAANVGNFLSLSILAFFIRFLPMLPIQLLLVNLLSDLPMVAIGVDRVSRAEVARPQAYDMKTLFVFVLVFGLVNSLFDFLFFGLFGGFDETTVRTGWFVLSIITEVVAFISLRTLAPFWRGGAPAKSILWFSVAAVLTSILLPLIGTTRMLFSFSMPTTHLFLMIGTLTVVYLAINEISKALYRRWTERTAHVAATA